MSDKFKDLVEQIEKLSVMDLAELVKVLEEKFGVTAAAPMAMAMAPAAGGAAAADAEEKTSFTVELTGAGEQKINVIKALREVTALSLKEAKDMVDAAPQVVKEGASKEEADKIKAALDAAGATVTLK
jgi:large subunit ribosomal protein L7/L12